MAKSTNFLKSKVAEKKTYPQPVVNQVNDYMLLKFSALCPISYIYFSNSLAVLRVFYR